MRLQDLQAMDKAYCGAWKMRDLFRTVEDLHAFLLELGSHAVAQKARTTRFATFEADDLVTGTFFRLKKLVASNPEITYGALRSEAYNYASQTAIDLFRMKSHGRCATPLTSLHPEEIGAENPVTFGGKNLHLYETQTTDSMATGLEDLLDEYSVPKNSTLRTALVWHMCHSCSFNKTADVLGLGRLSLRSQLYRLRQRLEEDGCQRSQSIKKKREERFGTSSTTWRSLSYRQIRKRQNQV